MKRLGLSLICWWFFVCPLAAEAQEQHLAWAEEFYHQGEYYRAAQEYSQVLGQNPQQPQARLGLAKAYRSGGQVEQAIQILQGYSPRSSDEELLLGLCLLDVQPGALFLEQTGHRQTALPHLAASGQPRAQAFADEANVFAGEAPHNPWLTGGLSALVPGAGSAYLGRWREAAYAAFFTLGFGLAAQEQMQAERPDLALVFGGFALVFYGGNIYAAANGARKMNDEHNRARFNQIRSRYGIWFDPKGLLVEMKF